MQHTYHIEIEGIAPLIQGNPKSAELGLTTDKKRGASKKNDPEMWRAFIYREGEKLRHPSRSIESCLREAASEFKATGRRTMVKPVKRTCFVQGDWLTFTNKAEPDQVKHVAKRTQMGQLVQVYEPVFSVGWRMDFFLDLLDDDIISPGHLKEILDWAGLHIGLGVDRPKYGRFIVIKFDEVNAGKQVAA